MGRQKIRAAGMLKAVTQGLKTPILPLYPISPPPWFSIMNAIPPTNSPVRTIAPRQRAPDAKNTKLKNIYRPQPIRFPEDALRTNFYKDHPWELARPRVIVELDGKDHRHCDWSKGLQQPGIPLTGECVVQRQMWLMQNENMSKRKAYDSARREFYRLRQAEEIEQRIAVEEARYVGAYFGKSRLDVGMLLEDREFENWKLWAGKKTAEREARESSETDPSRGEDDTSLGGAARAILSE